MCLAIPGKIVKKTSKEVIVDYGTHKRQAALIDGKYKVGEYIIVQHGMVVQKIPRKEAIESLKAYQKTISG
ncbi:MAG: HypC/HybG/HupF family hydrogenase formation chaperone [Candidatus Woesearchaeota archaeon]